MAVASYEPCVVCGRGDTTTGFAVQGEADFVIGVVSVQARISLDQATGVLAVIAEREMGCDPGMVPIGQLDVLVRVCSECAQRTDTNIGQLERDGEAPIYRQPDEDPFRPEE